jgi:hypothetical protein
VIFQSRRAENRHNSVTGELVHRAAVAPDLAGRYSVELPGIEPAALPGNMPSELPVRSVSVRFSPAHYLRFRSRFLTASRAESSFIRVRSYRSTAVRRHLMAVVSDAIRERIEPNSA